MSRIYFHSRDGSEAEITGSERAYFGMYCSSLMIEALQWAIHDCVDYPSPFRKALPDHYANSYPPSKYQRDDSPFEESLRTALRVGFDMNIKLDDDTEANPFTVSLNTAIAVGSNPIILAARLHGQCEIHTWVSGPNRAWLADIIEHGRKTMFLRDNQGWESVLDLLRQSDKSPIVTSYSVTESFPNPSVANWKPPIDKNGQPNHDAWYDLSYEDQWDLAFAGLTKNQWLEMKPGNWSTYHFGNGLNAYQVASRLVELYS